MDKVIIFDTTLRDGEQSAGAALTIQKNWRSPASLKSWALTLSKPVSRSLPLEISRQFAASHKRYAVHPFVPCHTPNLRQWIPHGKESRTLRNLVSTCFSHLLKFICPISFGRIAIRFWSKHAVWWHALRGILIMSNSLPWTPPVPIESSSIDCWKR